MKMCVFGRSSRCDCGLARSFFLDALPFFSFSDGGTANGEQRQQQDIEQWYEIDQIWYFSFAWTVLIVHDLFASSFCFWIGCCCCWARARARLMRFSLVDWPRPLRPIQSDECPLLIILLGAILVTSQLWILLNICGDFSETMCLCFDFAQHPIQLILRTYLHLLQFVIFV